MTGITGLGVVDAGVESETVSLVAQENPLRIDRTDATRSRQKSSTASDATVRDGHHAPQWCNWSAFATRLGASCRHRTAEMFVSYWIL